MHFRTFCATLILSTAAAISAQPAATLLQKVTVGKVWAGHPVGFACQLHKSRLYLAYYDGQRRLTVASTPTDTISWTYQILPTSVAWDSHNYITMAFDDDDRLHLSGNMHARPLIYFRTEKPLDITTFQRIPAMTGQREQRCTYPQFMRGAANEFIFHYRDGGSGKGDEIYNVYDHATQTWKRLFDSPLTDGKGQMNAYFSGPKLGPDGYFHLAWVWRDHYSCDTNHNLSYMRSKDLRHWETAAGQPVALPVTLETPGLIVDPTPRSKSGLINMGIAVSFDLQKRAVITYHRYDEKGHSQIYHARWDNDHWYVTPATNWDWRWEFTGGGSVTCMARGGGLFVNSQGVLAENLLYQNKTNGLWKINPDTLKAEERLQPEPKDRMPDGWKHVNGTFPGLLFRAMHRKAENTDVHYFVSWETLDKNRDRPRPEPWPEPSDLVLWIVKGNL